MIERELRHQVSFSWHKHLNGRCGVKMMISAHPVASMASKSPQRRKLGETLVAGRDRAFERARLREEACSAETSALLIQNWRAFERVDLAEALRRDNEPQALGGSEPIALGRPYRRMSMLVFYINRAGKSLSQAGSGALGKGEGRAAQDASAKAPSRGREPASPARPWPSLRPRRSNARRAGRRSRARRRRPPPRPLRRRGRPASPRTHAGSRHSPAISSQRCHQKSPMKKNLIQENRQSVQSSR